MPDSQDTRIHLSCQHFRCDSFRFDAQGRRLILPFSSTRQTSTVKCPQCKGRMHVYDHGVMHVKDMPLQYGTTQTLEVHYHRYRCPHCGKTSSEEVPLTYPETRITHRAAAWVKGLMRWQMPVSTVQKITGIHWETIRRIHKQTMDEALVRRWLQIRESGYRPTYLAVDEFAIHKGHRYATCVMDLESGDVLWVGKGRSEADFAKFFEESGLEWLRGVKAVAMDMNASFNKLVRRHMPWADIVYDRYHMQAQYGKDVLGVVRLQEARRHKAEAERLRRLAEDEEDSQERKHLVLQARAETRAYSAVKSARWTLLRKDASLTGNARDALEDILEKHRDIAVCHSMKEELSELFRIRGGGGKGYALQEWKRWSGSAEASGIPALAGFARRKRERIDGLANHARHGISTGKLEGFNNRIKVAKRIGYGYRDDDFFFTTIRYISIPDLGSLSPQENVKSPFFIPPIPCAFAPSHKNLYRAIMIWSHVTIKSQVNSWGRREQFRNELFVTLV